jgi:hypothetical protein
MASNWLRAERRVCQLRCKRNSLMDGVDEVKDIRNKATVMEASAYQRHAPPHTGTRRGVPLLGRFLLLGHWLSLTGAPVLTTMA